MSSKLFISLSMVALLGLSATGYGTLYIDGHDKDGNIPKGDCLEMRCQYGCVEKAGTFEGRCCPSSGGNGEACKVGGVDINECCQENKGLMCSNGRCACPTDKPIWNGTQCCFDVGCGCGVSKTAEGCCPGQVKGCDGVCGSGKIDTGCGCGVIHRTSEGCCPGVVKGCDGVCGSGKINCGGGNGGLRPHACPSCG